MTLDSIKRWKAAVKKGETPPDKLFKQIAGAVVRDAGAPVDGPVTVILSTAEVDRVGDTIAVEGWDLANYRRNPVVLWAHDSSAPAIGRMDNLRVDGDALKGDITFASKEYEFAATIEKLVRGGFLNATSVGFRPKKWAFNEERTSDGWMPPTDFLEQELLEDSVVPVPAHPGALVEGRAAGIDMAPVVEWAEKTLDLHGGSPIKVAGLSRATLEAIRKELGAQRFFIVGAAELVPKTLPIAVPVSPDLLPKTDATTFKTDANGTPLPPAQKDAADGDPAADEKAQGENICGCGYAMEPGDKFCAMCGKAAPEKAASPEDPDDDGDIDLDEIDPDDDEDDDEKALTDEVIREALAT